MELKTSIGAIVQRAHDQCTAIPAFNIPYLPMMEPVIQAVADLDSFALVAVARLEWTKFEAQSPTAVAAAYSRYQNPSYVRLHLDHVPVIDEDHQPVDFEPIFDEAIQAGYDSLMIDGSRLALDENIRVAARAAALAHAHGKPLEAELGAVFGHEDGPVPPYEELYASGRGFTDAGEARRFVQETGCDWLSVAIGNIHGAISVGQKDRKKVEARLNIERLDQIHQAAQRPLVLHGGSGIKADNVRQAMRYGIAKINIGTEIRQAYETALRETNSILTAQQAVYERTGWVIEEFLGVSRIREKVLEP